MRLLFVADYLPLQAPVAFRIHDFARFLTPLGVQISVVSRVDLLKILRIKAGEHYGSIKVYRALSLDVRLSEAIIDIFQLVSTFLLSFFVALHQKVDFVIVSVPPGVPSIGAFLAAKLLRKKTVIDVRDKWEDYSIQSSKYGIVRFTNRRLKELFSILLRKADLVIGVTPSLVKDLKARGASNAVFIPNGVDLNLFHPREPKEKLDLKSQLGLAKDEVVLVYTGGIGSYYRPDIAIEAMHNLSNNGNPDKLKFILIGGGEKSAVQKILKQVKSFKLQEKVIFFGKKPREFVANLLPACDIGVVPFDDNPLWNCAQPTKFFEYCAIGLPSIVTVPPYSDLGKLVRDNQVGYVVKPMNTSEFEAALSDFCQKSYAERKKMGMNARSLVQSHFDRQRLAQLLLENLERLQNGQRRPK